MTLETLNTGWYKNVRSILEKYQLPSDLHTIKSQPFHVWKTRINSSLETENKNRIHQECHKNENGIITPKTKTKSIPQQLNKHDYQRTTQKEILNMTKHETKTLLIARYGMLECGKNFKGTLKERCDQCDAIDNENHRLNFCVKLRALNFYDADYRVEFNDIFSNDVEVLRNLILAIGKVWNTKNAHGTMRTE